MAPPAVTAGARAEQVARASYGRLLALLAAPTGDIPAAEDALADAFVAALTAWPRTGIPDNPEGWLLTVARNRLRDLWKSAAFRTSTPLADGGISSTINDLDLDLDAIGDKRLELLFVCAHPAIDPGIRTPLMLQTVLGVDAARIAAAFAVPESAMAQRLVRAKRRIRDARIPFVVPGVTELPGRLPAVLEAVYGAYAIDWQGTAEPADSLAAEALYLALTLAALLPHEPEVLGLAALLSFSRSREPARVSPTGDSVPLDAQDPARWDPRLLHQGETLLRRAHAHERIGRFQLEAAIQSVHCDRARSGTTDYAALVTLYTALVATAPTLGARVALAATIGEASGPAAGLAALDEVARHPGAERFQPAWATRAHLLAAAGRTTDARLAYQRAIALAADPGIRSRLEHAAAGLPRAGNAG